MNKMHQCLTFNNTDRVRWLIERTQYTYKKTDEEVKEKGHDGTHDTDLLNLVCIAE